MFNHDFLQLNKLYALPVFCLAGLFGCNFAYAESLEQEAISKIQNSEYERYLSLSYENDLVGDGSDKYYTSGVRATYFNLKTKIPPLVESIAHSIPTFDINEATGTSFSVGQNIYTPTSILSKTKNPNDRPYAAWLYGSVGLTTVSNSHVDDLEITLGIVGPQALGEQTQKFIHKHITNSPKPMGWNNQLDFEPGLIVSWQRRWPRGFNADWTFDFGSHLRLQAEPSMNISIGNIYTYAGTGLMLTFGPYQDTLQDTPPRVKPAISGTGYFDVPDQDWSWYLFAGIDGRAMARNIFLDGNSFDDDASVNKRTMVGDAVAGIAFTLGDYRLSYTANYRTKEFDAQPENTVFGSITLTTRF